MCGKHRNIVMIIIIFALSVPVTVRLTYAQQDEFIPYAKKFLSSPEGGGENNALSNYVRAMEELNINLYLRHQRDFDTILTNGWTGKEKEEIEILRSLQPILAEIWRGNEKAFLKYPPYDPPSSPIPNFLRFVALEKFLILQALYCEHINRPDYAVEWFKHSLMFAQRIYDKESSLVAKVISISREKDVLLSFLRFLLRQKLDKNTYRKIAEELAGLRSAETPLWHFVDKEDKYIYLLIDNPEQTLLLSGRKQPFTPEEKRMIEYINENKETVRRQYQEFSHKIKEMLKNNYPEIIRTDQSTLMANLPSVLRKDTIPDFREGAIREGVTYAIWSLTIATARVCAYRAEKGNIPAEISALREIGLTPPDDPFSNQSLKYISAGDRAYLYSIGPDLTDNDAKLHYDPTNGTISSGDIIVAIR